MDYDALEGKQLEKCISLMIDLINRKGAYDSAAFRKQKQIEKLGIENKKALPKRQKPNYRFHPKPFFAKFLISCCSLPSKTQKSDTQNAKNRSDLSDLRKPERFFLCNIIF